MTSRPSGLSEYSIVKSLSLLCSTLGRPPLAAPAATEAAGPNGCDDGGVVSDETNDHYVVSAIAGIYNGERDLVARVNFTFL